MYYLDFIYSPFVFYLCRHCCNEAADDGIGLYRGYQLLNKHQRRDQIKEYYYNIQRFRFKCNISTFVRPIWMIAMFTMGILASINSDFYQYAQWFVLWPIIFSYIIMVQILKIYYQTLSPYDKPSVVSYILFKHYGADIASVILSFLYLDGEEIDFESIVSMYSYSYPWRGNDSLHSALLFPSRQ